MTETREIKMAPRKMLTVLALNYGLPWILTGLAGALVFIVLGIVLSLKFMVLAMLWIFLVGPLAIAFLYFYYGFEPLTTFNCMPHTICFQDDRIEIKIFHKIPPKENPQNEEPVLNETATINDIPEVKTYSIPRTEFRQLKTGPDYALLFFGKKGWIWLPVEAFSDTSEMRNILEGFNEK